MSAPATSRLPLATLAMLAAAMAAFAVLVGLGLWQLQRRAEKAAFLERLQSEAKAAPFQGWADAGAGARDLARVSVTGRFLADMQAHVRVTLPELGLALYVIQPFRLADGRIILVNRGAVKAGLDGRPQGLSATPEGDVALTGFRRAPERRWWFSPPDDPARLIFAVRDPALIGRALGLAVDEAAMLEAERTPGVAAAPDLPLATDAQALIARIPDNHLQYAFTWFGLAATLLGVLGAYSVGRRRKGAL